jgi:hypothetical protein
MFLAASYDGHISRVFVDGRLAGRINLSALGKRFPDLADVYMPAVVVGIGMLWAIATVGLWHRRSLPIRLIMAAVAGLTAGIVIILIGGASTLPMYQPWIPVSGLVGGIAIALGFEEKAIGGVASQ